MAHIFEDRIFELSISTGTGDIALAGAVTAYRAFSSVLSIGDTLPYMIEAVDANGKPTGDYEYGLGTYSAANTITRTSVRGSSNAGAAVNFAAGTKFVQLAVCAPASAAAKAEWRAIIGAGAGIGANNDITSLAVLSSVNSGQLAGLRNIAINGGGLVQQSAAPTLTAALQYGAADQHQIGVTGGTSVSGTVGVLSNTGFSCGVGYGAIAASWTTGQFIYKHRMEGANTKFLNSKSVTVSGKLYQDTGGARNFTVSVGKPTTTLDNFSAVTTLGTSAAIPVSTGTVTPFSYTLAMGATDAALGLEVLFTDNTANTVATKNYVVGDLQVEIGAVASVFEQRPYQLEVVLCKRYYRTQQFYWQAQSPGGGPGMAWTWTFDTPMRVAPTIAFPTVVIAGGSPATVGGQTVDGCGLYCPGNANGQVQLTATATSRL